MSTSPRNLLLVFPPFAQITSPPLGICCLKGYLEQALPNWNVSTLDLNLQLHRQLFKIIQQRPVLSHSNFPEGSLGEIALSHMELVFQGHAPLEFYQRPDRYNMYADLLLRLVAGEQSYIQSILTANEGQPPPIINTWCEDLLKAKPNAIGISICYNQQLAYGLILARAIKKLTNVPIILGGGYFNDDSVEFLEYCQAYVDYVITGEGEQPLATLLSQLDSPTDIPGLTRIVQGHAVASPPEFHANIDLLGHPNFSDLEPKEYYSPEPVIPILTARGCYWRRCAFCTHYRSAGLTFRKHSIEFVIAELERHVARGIKHFAFIDEMISPQHFADLAEAIITAKLDIRYYALAKPVKQFSKKLLQRIHLSGCCFLLWGLESGSQRVLDLMEKGTKITDIELVLKHATNAGIYNHVYIIAGFPTETRQEYGETIELLSRNRNYIHTVHRGTFCLERGAPIFNNPAQFNITKIWTVGNNPLTPSYQYECASGMSQIEVRDVFATSLPFLRAFNPFAPRLSNFRDHTLLIYSFHGQALKSRPRLFPNIPV